MNGFKAFKFYTALRLHFTDKRFNVFANRGNLRGSYEKFLARNDCGLFEKLARQFSSERDFIQYVAANFMYGNFDCVYHSEESQENYKEFLRRRQSITRVFADDLDTIIKTGAHYEFSGHTVPDVIQLLLAKKITVETVVILNDLEQFVPQLEQHNHLQLLLGNELLRIEKSKQFVRYDRSKIDQCYKEFQGELHEHGVC